MDGQKEQALAVRACTAELVPAQQRKPRGRKIASGCIFWLGMALIGIVAIPAGILLGVLSLLVRLTAFLTEKIDTGA